MRAFTNNGVDKEGTSRVLHKKKAFVKEIIHTVLLREHVKRPKYSIWNDMDRDRYHLSCKQGTSQSCLANFFVLEPDEGLRVGFPRKSQQDSEQNHAFDPSD